MNMEAIKGILGPLGVNTASIQDTLVCVFRSSTHGNSLRSEVRFSETGRHRRYSRDGTEGLDICMEWICGLFVVPSRQGDTTG
jgi:hypothetical protein